MVALVVLSTCIGGFVAILSLTDRELPKRLAIPLVVATTLSLVGSQVVGRFMSAASTPTLLQVCAGLAIFVVGFLALATGALGSFTMERLANARTDALVHKLESALRIRQPPLTVDIRAKMPRPTPAPEAAQLAAEIPAGGGPYVLALKALGEHAYDVAARLLEDAAAAADGGEADALRLARARLWAYLGRYSDAGAIFTKLAAAHPANAALHTEGGAIAVFAGDLAQAQAKFQRALEIQKDEGGGTDVTIAASMCNLAMLAAHRKLPEEAEALLKRAADIVDTAPQPCEETDAIIHERLGALYATRDKPELAKQAYRRALTSWQRLHGMRHHCLTTCLKPLANIHTAEKEYGQAEMYLQQALAINLEAQGADHLDVAGDLFSLGQIHCVQEQWDRALTYFMRALSIREVKLRGHEDDVVITRRAIIAVRVAQEDFIEAGAQCHILVEDLERQRGAGHPDLLGDLRDLAGIYVKLHRFEAADEAWQRVLKGQRRYPQSFTPFDVADTLESYAMMLRNAGRLSDAKQREEDAETLRAAAEANGQMASLASLRQPAPEEEHPPMAVA